MPTSWYEISFESLSLPHFSSLRLSILPILLGCSSRNVGRLRMEEKFDGNNRIMSALLQILRGCKIGIIFSSINLPDAYNILSSKS